MNEVLKAIAQRYSCRDFADNAPLDSAQIEAIVKAALAAPSGLNRQPWHIMVITDKALIEEMDAEGMRILAESPEHKETYERMMSRGGKLLYNAPCMFLIASEALWAYATMDCGILCQNITLAAQSLGLGSIIVAMTNVPLSGTRGEEFKKRVKFPEGYTFGMSVLVGTVQTGKEPHDLDMSKVTYI